MSLSVRAGVRGRIERACWRDDVAARPPACRYSYAGQVAATHWNTAQLATAFLAADLVEKDEAQALVDAYPKQVRGTPAGPRACQDR